MLFCAELTDFKIVCNVLRSILFRDFAVLRPMEEGLKITVEEMKSVEISTYIPCNMFSYYHIDTKTVNENDIIFKISLKILTEIFNIFGDDGNPSLKLVYKDVGAPLNLLLKHNEENITIDCELKTMNVDDFNDMSLSDECNLNKIVINADIFVELLQRLDNSADEFKLTLSPDPPYCTLSTTGISGESQVNISKNSESVSVFKCSKSTSADYSFANIRQIFKVMSYANKVAISTGESGLLGLQLVINADSRQMYVEYYVSSQFGDD